MEDVKTRVGFALADRHRVEREIGGGGLATIHLARDLNRDREVAPEVIRPEVSAVLRPERFLIKIRIALQLDRPHILTLTDSGEADRSFYYVLKFAKNRCEGV